MTTLDKLFLIQKKIKQGISGLASIGIDCMSGDEASLYVALRGVEDLIDEYVTNVRLTVPEYNDDEKREMGF